MPTRDIPPVAPGDYLREYLDELGLTPYALARAIHVDPRRINLILHGKRALTADTSLRLGRFFGQHGSFWLKIQMEYDVETAEQQHGEQLWREVKPWQGVLSQGLGAVQE
jgi:antitoxin HigA-1